MLLLRKDSISVIELLGSVYGKVMKHRFTRREIQSLDVYFLPQHQCYRYLFLLLLFAWQTRSLWRNNASCQAVSYAQSLVVPIQSRGMRNWSRKLRPSSATPSFRISWRNCIPRTTGYSSYFSSDCTCFSF